MKDGYKEYYRVSGLGCAEKLSEISVDRGSRSVIYGFRIVGGVPTTLKV